MEKIQMVDLHRQYARIKPEIDHAIEKVLTSTAFIQGPDVQEFAQALAGYLDVRAVIPCANGTDALQIAMMALGFRPGDEIILPVHTYVATAEVIALLGLTPVFAEVRADSFTLDPARLEEKITPRTVAIVPVHLYGQCADMEPLLHIAQKHNLHIIEDAAQALGADYTFSDKSVKKAGTMGTIGTTSFFPSKNLGCYGDGGALFTHDESLAARIKMIANHGQQVKYHHDLVGVNSRLDTLQAAILRVKLQYLDDYARRRNDAAVFYDRVLARVPQVTIPWRAPYSTHVYHQYTLQIGEGKRDALKQHLEQQGIPTMIYYPVPLHLQKAYRQADAGPGTFAITEKLSQTVLSLPIHTEMEASQLEYIGDAITRFF
ncbi:DegT/DnrJ/EryC1/StrS family aminotransferase [Dawidia soli]|uniref:DegT/DnrJ/EryC1/StrS family aminotransferase n=1 Tax=Dawidia soli TaxID=2782352 RepID=A0AAP2DIU6_9BACT|nr:DegT/DnrJ/EryC1/StrS family aminotransferase [Dawidia soli]MBT1690207.1 DegT/DnrJ/EryC1/StrS family aminotransferase [Dawidia soli]